MFSTLSKTEFIISVLYELSYASALNLVQSKKLLFGIHLNILDFNEINYCMTEKKALTLTFGYLLIQNWVSHQQIPHASLSLKGLVPANPKHSF